MGLIELDEATHTYTHAGRVVPSVTQALSVIERGFGFADPDLLDRSRRFGSNVHLAIALFNDSTLIEEKLDFELSLYLAQYKRFLFETKFKVTMSEQIVHNVILNYAGKFDLRGIWKGSTYLCDLKSGAVPHTVGPQTSAYQMAHAIRPKRRICLQLKRDGYKLIALDNASDFSIFVSALNCYRFLNRRLSLKKEIPSDGNEKEISRSGIVQFKGDGSDDEHPF